MPDASRFLVYKEPIITVENLGKRYQLGAARKAGGYTTLRDTMANSVRNLLRRPAAAAASTDFWALREVSFEIARGEVVGIVGRNGAGKSTLLKILSRITEPTTGRIEITGRIASLLEVGTGFHPELTGRENIFLNGAILGMSRAEMRLKFDEIVAFAEVAKFIDTPVKRYSSGMYVRLAFAVAAHIEPEILIVDEVLAVGDAQFQKKCLGKMGDFAKGGGKTVLFVSHNMAAVRALCRKGICLREGQISHQGPIGDVVDRYLDSMSEGNQQLEFRKREIPPAARVYVSDFWIEDSIGQRITSIDPMQEVVFKLQIAARTNTLAGVNIRIRSHRGYLIWIDSDALQRKQFAFAEGTSVVTCNVEPLRLTSGAYSVDLLLQIHNQEWIDEFNDAADFVVPAFDPYESGFDFSDTFAAVHVAHSWEFDKIRPAA